MESKKRTLAKTILWRLIAIANSFIVLLATLTDSPLKNALIMNATGFMVYFIYERVWNKISWGTTK